MFKSKRFSIRDVLALALGAIAGFIADSARKAADGLFNHLHSQGLILGVTSIPAGHGLANKQFSKALSAMATRQPTPLKSLTGPMPSEDDAMRKIRQQSTIEMPVVRVDELSKGERVALN